MENRPLSIEEIRNLALDSVIDVNPILRAVSRHRLLNAIILYEETVLRLTKTQGLTGPKK